MKKIVLIITLVFTLSNVQAQQEALFTHYMFNTQVINPAYAGSREALTITGLHRTQWFGFDGAPVTQTITAHSPIANNKMGLGLSIENDKSGPESIQSIYADYAYKIGMGDKGTLSFGLKAGLNFRNIALSKVRTSTTGDPSFSGDDQSQLLPNFGLGAYYSQERFYVGLSSPKILQNNFKNNSISSTSKEIRHYFLIAGTVFDLTSNVKLKPTTFVRVTQGAPVVADLTATFIFHDRFNLGAMYRTGDALGMLLGYNFTEQFTAGYSFDWSYGVKTFKYNKGSHEIMLRYDLIFNNKGKIKSPRYF